VSCFAGDLNDDACRHQALIDVSPYGEDIEVPSVWLQLTMDRRAAKLERAADGREPDHRQAQNAGAHGRFTSDFNRNTSGCSPDRVDALVWALTSLSEPDPPEFAFA
jgi:hypothetical protein